jgi:hypothetical protein
MPAPDDFGVHNGLDAQSMPATKALAITPNNGADLAFATRGIYIGGGGNLRVDMQDGGVDVTFVGLAAGTILPVRVSRVYATGTTATSLVGLR